MSWLLRNVRVDGAPADVRIEGGRIVDEAPHLDTAPADEIFDGQGATLLPGLADHHLHLFAAAAATGSVDVSAGLLSLRAVPGEGWIRAVGARTELRREDLDRVCDTRPVRVQHRGGSLWTLNSPAIDLLRPSLTPAEVHSGQVWRGDDRLRRERLADPDLIALGQRLARHGITHVTDATVDLTADAVDRLTMLLPQHVTSLGLAGPAPRKIVIADHEPPDLDTLIQSIGRSHEAGRAVALHCLTRVSLALAIAALSTVGSHDGDRIEHAAVCDDEAADELARLGVVVVTQPSLMARHGDDYRADSDPADREYLWRYAGLRQAGVPVVASSDAPYGDLDPWHGMAAATTGLATAERVIRDVTLGSYLTEPTAPAGPPRRVAPGEPADLCLVDPDVVATFIDGEPVYRRGTD